MEREDPPPPKLFDRSEEGVPLVKHRDDVRVMDGKGENREPTLLEVSLLEKRGGGDGLGVPCEEWSWSRAQRV